MIMNIDTNAAFALPENRSFNPAKSWANSPAAPHLISVPVSAKKVICDDDAPRTPKLFQGQ